MKTNENLAYLNALPSKDRAALMKIREQVLKAGFDLEEKLCRGVPFFYYKKKRVVGLGAYEAHLSFYVMDGLVLPLFSRDLVKFERSSTVIRFSSSHLIPKKIIRKIVCARVEEIDLAFFSRGRR